MATPKIVIVTTYGPSQMYFVKIKTFESQWCLRTVAAVAVFSQGIPRGQTVTRVATRSVLTRVLARASLYLTLVNICRKSGSTIRSWHGDAFYIIDTLRGNPSVINGFPMMTSSNGNIFRVTEPSCGEFIGRRWIPHTMASDAQLWSFLWSVPE